MGLVCCIFCCSIHQPAQSSSFSLGYLDELLVVVVVCLSFFPFPLPSLPHLFSLKCWKGTPTLSLSPCDTIPGISKELFQASPCGHSCLLPRPPFHYLLSGCCPCVGFTSRTQTHQAVSARQPTASDNSTGSYSSNLVLSPQIPWCPCSLLSITPAYRLGAKLQHLFVCLGLYFSLHLKGKLKTLFHHCHIVGREGAPHYLGFFVLFWLAN